MLINICGDYFRVDSIRHIYTKTELNEGSDETTYVVVELLDSELSYFFEFNEEVYNCTVTEYLKEKVYAINLL